MVLDERNGAEVDKHLVERRVFSLPPFPPRSGPKLQWGTMEGGSTGGYFAIRMKSDIIY